MLTQQIVFKNFNKMSIPVLFDQAGVVLVKPDTVYTCPICRLLYCPL